MSPHADVLPSQSYTYRIIYDGNYTGVVGANSFSISIDPILTDAYDTIYFGVRGYGISGSSGDAVETSVTSSGSSGGSCGTDGRVNAADCARDTWALYVNQEGDSYNINVWDSLLGQSVIFVFADDIAALPANPEENTVIATSADGRMILSKLTTGEYQLNVFEPDGKVSVIVFTLPLTDSYRLDYGG